MAIDGRHTKLARTGYLYTLHVVEQRLTNQIRCLFKRGYLGSSLFASSRSCCFSKFVLFPWFSYQGEHVYVWNKNDLLIKIHHSTQTQIVKIYSFSWFVGGFRLRNTVKCREHSRIVLNGEILLSLYCKPGQTGLVNVLCFYGKSANPVSFSIRE